MADISRSGRAAEATLLGNALTVLKTLIEEVGARVTEVEVGFSDRLSKALDHCTAAIKELSGDQITASKRVEGVHAELLEEMRRGQASSAEEARIGQESILSALRQNQSVAEKEQQSHYSKTKAELSSIGANVRQITAAVQHQQSNQDSTVTEVQQSQIVIKKLQQGQATMESTMKSHHKDLQEVKAAVQQCNRNHVKTIAKIDIVCADVKSIAAAVQFMSDSVLESQTKKAKSLIGTPSKSSRSPPDSPQLSMSISFVDGTSIGTYADRENPMKTQLDKAHHISKVMKHVNEAYSLPSKVFPGTQSRFFKLKSIMVSSGSEKQRLSNSPSWTAWIDKHAEEKGPTSNVDVEMVFEAVDDAGEGGSQGQLGTSKKRKLDDNGQAQLIDAGRNVFGAVGC